MSFNYGNILGLPWGEEKRTSTTDFASLPIGTRAVSPDGLRAFRYAFSQAAIPAGQMTMTATVDAALDMDLVIPANIAIGSGSITATLAATALTLDQMKDGYIYVNDGPGEGHVYHIQGNAAASASAAATLRLGDDIVREALTTASLVGLSTNPYFNVEIHDGDDVDGIPTGVAPTEIADNAFFWCQTWGPAAVLAAATVPVVGKMITPDLTVDGAVGAEDGTILTPHLGIAMLIPAVAGDYGMVFLQIAP